MCFNKEMDALNKRIQTHNVSQYTGNITYPSFKLYVDILEEASKATASINFPVKDTLNKNLQGIKKNHSECQKRIREQSSYQFTGRSTYSGGSSNSGSSYVGGCLQEIFARIVGIAIMVAILSFFGWICG